MMGDPLSSRLPEPPPARSDSPPRTEHTPRKRKPGKSGKPGMAIWLFFGPFALGGLVLLGLGAWHVTQHLRALSWEPATAVLLSRGEQVARNPGTGTASIGGASRITARYAYTWQGRAYEGEQVAFANAMTRTFGTRDRWKELLDEALGEEGGSIRVWVNPARPDEAVVVRDINWFELTVYLGVGLFLVFAASVMLGGARRAKPASHGPDAAPPGFSWRVVALMWLTGAPLAVVAVLAWRDGHSVGGTLSALPLFLALYGTWFGLTHGKRP